MKTKILVDETIIFSRIKHAILLWDLKTTQMLQIFLLLTWHMDSKMSGDDFCPILHLVFSTLSWFYFCAEALCIWLVLCYFDVLNLFLLLLVCYCVEGIWRQSERHRSWFWEAYCSQQLLTRIDLSPKKWMGSRKNIMSYSHTRFDS